MLKNKNHIFMPKNHMDKLYNSNNPIVKFVHVNRLNSITRMISDENNLKILDAGCGEGHLIEKLHHKIPIIYTMDLILQRLHYSRQKKDAHTAILN